MNLIFVRSPYMISVNETGQTGAKVKLYIWNFGDTEPTIPTYTLSKDIPSTTQLELNFNISNYAREFIDNINPSYPPHSSYISQESNKSSCYVKVKRYKTVSGVDTLLDTNTYTATNGFTKYEDGLNSSLNSNIISLTDKSKTIYYDRNQEYPYINVFAELNTGQTIKFQWEELDGSYLDDSTQTATTANLYEINVSVTQDGADFSPGNLLKIIDVDGITVIDSFKVMPVCEPKYSPVVCSYINRRGGWQFLTFFKAQTNTISTKGSTYRMMPSQLDYNIYQAQTKSFNINGQQSVKLNTGWVDENYSDLITDLLLSETILLDGKPVELKTTSSDLKTSLKDKMINYEIEFDYAFNLINDVV
jgi:hypothetical protein